MKQKHIVIVGGGTSGWMTANILSYAFKHLHFKITVVESSEIKTVGVGEGSTPALKVFFDKLGIAESEWMPKCNATYKCGIRFDGWSTKPGCESYFHPFSSQIDSQTLGSFVRNVQARLSGKNVEFRPDRFFLSAKLAQANFAPIAGYNFPFEINYGYHFDADLLGKFLKNIALARGVRHHFGTIKKVAQKDGGDVDYLLDAKGKKYKGDIFVDCSGFASVLSQKTLKTPFQSYKSDLFNDAAVAMPSTLGQNIPSQTVSTAMRFGWVWKIPLRTRFGNGYVYSSEYCSADEAEFELRRSLNLLESDVEARHLRMKVGRVSKSWHKNVLAVGLSQGFIEPLEATALLLIQQTASLFAHFYGQGNFTEQHAETFNALINEQFDRTKDYIFTHYQTNSRYDTPYWRDNRENKGGVSESLSAIYRCWNGGGNLEQELQRQKIERYYPVSSWYCIFAGMGMFPDSLLLKTVDNKNNPYSIRYVEQFIKRCALNFSDHQKVLMDPIQFAQSNKAMSPERQTLELS